MISNPGGIKCFGSSLQNFIEVQFSFDNKEFVPVSIQRRPQREYIDKYNVLTLRPFILTFFPQKIFQRKLHKVLNASALSSPLHPEQIIFEKVPKNNNEFFSFKKWEKVPVIIQLLVQNTLCSRHVNL